MSIRSIKEKVVGFFKSWIHKIDKNMVDPAFRWVIALLSRKIESESEPLPMVEWKEQVLNDFQNWIGDIPDNLPETADPSLDACDLYTLLAEFSSLRQEIKLQNREQTKTLETMGGFMEEYKNTSRLFESRSQDLGQLEEKVRKTTEKRVLLPFLDIRDILVRGALASREVMNAKGFLRRLPRGIEGVAEGYETAIKHFDRALGYVGISYVETSGRIFNPDTMKALDKRSVPEMGKGIVLEEQLSGFVRGDEIIRRAEVVINIPEVKPE